MSEAPEKLFRTLAYNKATKRACVMVFPSRAKAERDGAAGADITEYHRADHSAALVAAAYADLAMAVESLDGYDNIGGEHPIVSMVRESAPADARAALDKIVQERDEALNQLDSALHSVAVLERRVSEAREEALREAAAECVKGPKTPEDCDALLDECIGGLDESERIFCARAILALITKGKADG